MYILEFFLFCSIIIFLHSVFLNIIYFIRLFFYPLVSLCYASFAASHLFLFLFVWPVQEHMGRVKQDNMNFWGCNFRMWAVNNSLVSIRHCLCQMDTCTPAAVRTVCLSRVPPSGGFSHTCVFESSIWFIHEIRFCGSNIVECCGPLRITSKSKLPLCCTSDNLCCPCSFIFTVTY